MTPIPPPISYLFNWTVGPFYLRVHRFPRTVPWHVGMLWPANAKGYKYDADSDEWLLIVQQVFLTLPCNIDVIAGWERRREGDA